MEKKTYFRILYYDAHSQDVSEIHPLDIIEEANGILKHRKVTSVSHAIEAICIAFKSMGMSIFFIDRSNDAVLSKEVCPAALYDKVRNLAASRTLRHATSKEEVLSVLR